MPATRCPAGAERAARQRRHRPGSALDADITDRTVQAARDPPIGTARHHEIRAVEAANPLARPADRAYSGQMKVSIICAAARASGSPVAAA
jgi:hypothetical protein